MLSVFLFVSLELGYFAFYSSISRRYVSSICGLAAFSISVNMEIHGSDLHRKVILVDYIP